MKYQNCRKCGGPTMHETRAFNNIAARRQDVVTRCKKCESVSDVKSVAITDQDRERLRKKTY